jgi:hypothetical protein
MTASAAWCMPFTLLAMVCVLICFGPWALGLCVAQCDVCFAIPAVDADGDCILNSQPDNCLNIPNPDQVWHVSQQIGRSRRLLSRVGPRRWW